MKIRIKSRQTGPSKFKSEWSGPHEVVAVRGVLVTVRELSTGRTYHIHHDRLPNPVLLENSLLILLPLWSHPTRQTRILMKTPKNQSMTRDQHQIPLLRSRVHALAELSDLIMTPYSTIPQFYLNTIRRQFHFLRVHSFLTIHSCFHHTFLMSRHLPHQPSQSACLTFVWTALEALARSA